MTAETQCYPDKSQKREVKRKLSSDAMAQEDLEIKRWLLQQLKTSGNEFVQTMDRLNSNIEMLVQHIMGSGNRGYMPPPSPHTSHQNQYFYAHTLTRRPLGEYNPPAHNQHSTSPLLYSDYTHF